MSRPIVWCCAAVLLGLAAYGVGHESTCFTGSPVIVHYWEFLGEIDYAVGPGYHHRLGFAEGSVPLPAGVRFSAMDSTEAADWDVVYNIRLRCLKRRIPYWTRDASAKELMTASGFGLDGYALKVASGNLTWQEWFPKTAGLERRRMIASPAEYVITFPGPERRAFRFVAVDEFEAFETAMRIIWHEDRDVRERVVREAREDLATLGRPLPE